MAKKKPNSKKIISGKLAFAILLIALGLVFNALKIGMNEFFSYNSVGNYLIYCGALIVFITSIRFFRTGEKLVDERAEKIGYYATRWTLSAAFLLGFILMIYDGIKPVSIRLSEFISYSICAVLLIYIICYRIVARRF
ncbi:MAG: hypothetical protein NTZ02_00290 [Candidatus Woesearchaeota archaeon]|nr:hypothetical protein [Candidatus Woesearchaeota archaeon]